LCGASHRRTAERVGERKVERANRSLKPTPICTSTPLQACDTDLCAELLTVGGCCFLVFLQVVDLRRVQGSRCRVQGAGFRVKGSGFRVQGSGFRVQGSGVWVQGSGFMVQDAEFKSSGFRIQGSGFRVQGSGSRVQGPGFMMYGFGPAIACAGARPQPVPPSSQPGSSQFVYYIIINIHFNL
jgi:hypothetical protein